MPDVITAVYENGVLRPLMPLPLQERQTVERAGMPVRFQILPNLLVDETERVVQDLVIAGLLTPPPGHSDIEPISEEKRSELAEILGKASNGRLSEMIIEERGER